MRRTPVYRHHESGSTLVAVIILAFIMIVLTVSAFQFGAQDASLAAQSEDRSQALYIAEAGLARAHTWLEAQNAPPGGTNAVLTFGTDPEPLACGGYLVTIEPDSANVGSARKRYRIISEATAGTKVRTVTLDVGTQSFAEFIYFTEEEHLPNSNTPVWFCSSDYIGGTAPTNGQLHLFGDPEFGGHVTSAHGGPDDPDPENDPAFMYYNGSYWDHLESAEASNAPYDQPVFGDGYGLGAPAVDLPDCTDDLVDIAHHGGIYLDGNYQIVFARRTDFGRLYGYVSYCGTDGVWTDVPIADFNGVLYVNGDISIQGIVDGSITVGSGGDVTIANDIVYADADPVGGPNQGCDDMLGLISEGNIILEDNRPNQGDLNIHAHMMALNTSFMTENYSTGNPRGTLTIHGGVIQKFRGAVGTGYLAGGEVVIRTGYSKNYHYDLRFNSTQPPGYFLTGEYRKLGWQEVT